MSAPVEPLSLAGEAARRAAAEADLARLEAERAQARAEVRPGALLWALGRRALIAGAQIGEAALEQPEVRERLLRLALHALGASPATIDGAAARLRGVSP